jgi:3-oxoacyl-[acyl-carrier protein] reductase
MSNVFITGGSRGVGRALVLYYVTKGWGVAFTYSSSKTGADETIAAAKAIDPAVKVAAYKLSLENPQEIDVVGEAVIKDFETITAVVNNAGLVRDGAAALLSNEDWNQVIAVNLTGPFFVSRFFLMHMLSNRKGRLIHISSISADGSTGQVNYAAAKAGLVGMSRTIAKEYGKKNITSNIVTVGYVPTDMTADHLNEQLHEYWLKHCPAKRPGTAEEVAATVFFLSSDEASFVSGENIRLGAGLTYAP